MTWTNKCGARRDAYIPFNVQSNSRFHVFSFSFCWEWDRVSWNWENSALLVQFGKSLKENELDKLRKYTLNQHFLLTTTLPLIVSFGICALHIQLLYMYLKFSLWQSAANWDFCLLLGKRYYLALELCPKTVPKFTRIKIIWFRITPLHTHMQNSL